MIESKYIRADLLWNKIAESAFFSAAEKGKIRAVIEKEPGEDVKPVVHGEWIDGTKRQTCSICRYRGVHSWTYCPNCGSKMDEEEGNAEIV